MNLNLDGHAAYAYTGTKAFNPAQPTLVFVHGAQNDHSVWALQSRWFAHHGFNVLALDLPGHGRSAGAPRKRVQDYADWVLGFTQAAGARRFAVAGHSMGSLIALECAAQASERVTHLALLATAYPMKVSAELLATSLSEPERAMRMVNQWSFSTLAAKPALPGPGAWLHGGGMRLMQRVQAAQSEVNVFHNDFMACNAYANGEQAAQALRCPVLFLLGERDLMTPPRAAKALQAALPQARTVLLKAGHQLMAEQPDGALLALRDFLKA